jgi:predicted glycogen debranching enzyme
LHEEFNKPAMNSSDSLIEQIRIQIPRETCSDYYFATQKEWLETNGIGGFASSTIIGANVRRYHGLLVASLHPPTHRFVLLSKFDESASINGKNYELSTNQYPFIVYPEGHKNIDRFEYDLYPRFIFQINGTVLEKSIAMIHGENSTIVRYRVVKSSAPVQLTLRPLCAFRDYHGLSHENSALDHNIIKLSDNHFSMKPYSELPAMFVGYNKGKIEPKFFWYKNAEYRKEQERGLEFVEDLFSPAYLSAVVAEGESLDLIITLDETRAQQSTRAASLFDNEVQRRKTLLESCPLRHPLAKSLALAADSFLVHRNDQQRTVIAGYHWFGDWGRDTMISLTGLTLSCRKFDIAKGILRSFSNYISEGMIPNRFPDLGETPEYNNVDGTLWYFIAVYNYLNYTGDFEFIKNELYDKLATIIDWHIRGTRYGIKMDSDGLLFAGQEGVQLTWMDAKIGDWVVTPRMGKPVEVNALWYNALCIMAALSEKMNLSDHAKNYAGLAERAKKSFGEQFWNPERLCLFDVVNGSEKNADIRPNQVFAVSLPFEIIDLEKQKAVVAVVKKELLTPYGLRSLSKDNPQFIGMYAGDPRHRDSAYHQGTVWTWLIGHYIEAVLKVNRYSPAAKGECKEIIDRFEKQLSDSGIAAMAEIFDGDNPHFPQGCISQAWSVAEILRAVELLEKI